MTEANQSEQFAPHSEVLEQPNTGESLMRQLDEMVRRLALTGTNPMMLLQQGPYTTVAHDGVMYGPTQAEGVESHNSTWRQS